MFIHSWIKPSTVHLSQFLVGNELELLFNTRWLFVKQIDVLLVIYRNFKFQIFLLVERVIYVHSELFFESFSLMCIRALQVLVGRIRLEVDSSVLV